jgi:D-alanyl-D-alanine carboxypeptidase
VLRPCVAVTLATLAAWASAGPAAAARPAKRADAALDRALERVVEMPGGPPGVVAIVQRGKRLKLHRAGVADLRTRRRIRARDHMRLASASKAFSGAVVLALVSRGVLALDDTIGQRLPDLPRSSAAVTLRQLLNHTSGLPNFTKSPAYIAYLEATPHTPLPPRRLLEFVADEPLQFPPGSRYAYSNSDNIVAGLMVEAATGRSYRRELRARVLRPLGLTQTTLPVGFRLPRPYIHGYDIQPARPPDDISTAISASLVWASGGVVSTPAELNRFIRTDVGGRLFTRGARGEQLRFVEGSSEPPGPGQNAAGLAIFRYRTRCGTVYGHTGNFPGYTQFAAASRDGRRSVTVSANEQLSPEVSPSGRIVFRALRRAEARAVCAALAPRRLHRSRE